MSEGIPAARESVAQFPEIASEINAMVKVDQDMRGKNLLDPKAWDESVDARNTERMKGIVAQIGWPTTSKVGKDASHGAWLLVQHADHQVDFQEQCLALMKQEPADEVNSPDVARFEDRVRVNKNQPQLYGTQFRQYTGEHKPLPIEDEANVNQRRRQMGLGTLEEGIAEMYEQYGPPDQS